jgi:hypothetical protein
MIFPNPFRFFWAMVVSGYGRLRGYQILARPAVSDARLQVCEPCEFRDGEQCSICTCFLGAKTMLNLEKCPKRKWSRVWEKRSTI